MTQLEREEHDYQVAAVAKAAALEVAKTLALQVAERLNVTASGVDGHKSPCQHAQATRWYAVTILAGIGSAVLAVSIWAVSTYNSQARRSDAMDIRMASTESTQSADMREIRVTLDYMKKDIAAVKTATTPPP